MNKSTLSDRAVKARKHAGLSQADAARRIGISRGAVGQWENGDTKSINSAYLHSAARVYGVRSEWLASGKGDMTVKREMDKKYPELATAGTFIEGKAPVISWVKAGNWTEAIDIYAPGYAEDWAPKITGGLMTYVLIVRGDSMMASLGVVPTFLAGEHIHVDPERRSPENGEFVIARQKGFDEVTFKQFKVEDGRPYLSPLNSDFPKIWEEFEVLGTVVYKGYPF